MKKSQVTIFIIIGIVIVLGFFLLFYLRELQIQQVVEPEIYEGVSLQEKRTSLQKHIQSCITMESKNAVIRLGKLGGSFNLSDSIYYLADEINVLCEEKVNEGCVNNVLLKKDMEKEITDFLWLTLQACIDFDKFAARGYNISYNFEDMVIVPEINNEDVVVNVRFPIGLFQNSDKAELAKFNTNVDLALGSMYNLAVDIVNSEIVTGSFDKDDWMVENGGLIEIRKVKPYPDLIYILENQGMMFRFAVKKLDQAGKGLVNLNNAYGNCMVDDYCFANTAECNGTYVDSCSEFSGYYVEGCCVNEKICTLTTESQCNGEFYFDKLCGGQECLNFDCGEHKHGSSWCVDTGDHVGERHSFKSCLYGEIIEEECADYREEVCVETLVDNSSKAKCRDNRWRDCSKVDNKASCESGLRDCMWVADDCVPKVAPGFKFWDLNGGRYCASSNQNKITGFSNQEWVDEANKLCFMSGDCGNYYNVENVLGIGGYYNPLGKERSYEKDDVVLDFDAVGRSNLFSGAAGVSSGAGFADTFRRLDNYGTKFEKFDLNKGFGSESSCGLWQPPVGGCGCDDCSEYRCRSLSQNCLFTYNKGLANCFVKGEGDSTSPEIRFDFVERYNYTEAKLLDIAGVKLNPDIMPHESVILGVRTSEDTKCKVKYAPNVSLLPFFFFDDEFKDTHNLSFRLPKQIVIPDGLLLRYNATDITGLLDLVEPDPVLSKIVEDFQNRTYYIFVECVDLAGNVNEDEFFVSFSLGEVNDTFGPLLVEIDPANGSIVGGDSVAVRVELDEPSECKADINDKDFSTMGHEFDCVISEYEMSDSGTYACSGVIPYSRKYFLKCIDNPVVVQEYDFSLVASDVSDSNIVNNTLIVDVDYLDNNVILNPVPVNLLIRVYGNAECEWNGVNMGCAFVDGVSTCDGYLEFGNHSIICAEVDDKKHNVASYVYYLEKSAGLNITAVYPGPYSEVDVLDPRLQVWVTGNVNSTNCGVYIDEELQIMDVFNDSFVRTVDLESGKDYYLDFYCENGYGDTASGNTSFAVIV